MRLVYVSRTPAVMSVSMMPGRTSYTGMPEAALSEPLAKNKHLKIGDVIAGPTDEGGIAGAPVPVRCVGILSGPVWIAVTTKTFCDMTFLAAPRSTVIQPGPVHGGLAGEGDDLEELLQHLLGALVRCPPIA